jgi:phage repressor protein C with HTH and peptisase S24 domain
MTSDTMIDALRKRLARAIEYKGVTAKALARTAGLGETVVRDILQGMTKDVKLGTVEKLAKALGLSVSDLLPDAFAGGQASDHLPNISAYAGDGPVVLKQVDLAYAMGAGSELSDFPDEMPMLFDPGFIRSLTLAAPDHLYVAQGTGDSMFPTLLNGDQVIIDTTQRTLNMQDRIWALSVYGAGMIKRLRAIAGGRVRIMSDNSTVPPEEVDAQDVFIAGRVIWIGRKA